MIQKMFLSSDFEKAVKSPRFGFDLINSNLQNIFDLIEIEFWQILTQDLPRIKEIKGGIQIRKIITLIRVEFPDCFFFFLWAYVYNPLQGVSFVLRLIDQCINLIYTQVHVIVTSNIIVSKSIVSTGIV